MARDKGRGNRTEINRTANKGLRIPGADLFFCRGRQLKMTLRKGGHRVA